MEDYTFYDFETTDERPTRYIHFSKINTAFWARVSKNIAKEIDSSGLTRCRVRRDNITGEICLVLNKDKGAQVGRNSNGLFIRGGKQFYEFFKKMFNMKEDAFNLLLSHDKSNNFDYLTYVVTKADGKDNRNT